MAPLVPCSRCARHVRVSDVRCPFCDVAIGEDARDRVVPSTTRRLDRWAFFTFATAVSVAACSSGGSGGIDDAGNGKADTGGAQPPYGTPRDDGGMQALYGAVPADAALDDAGSD